MLNILPRNKWSLNTLYSTESSWERHSCFFTAESGKSWHQRRNDLTQHFFRRQILYDRSWSTQYLLIWVRENRYNSWEKIFYILSREILLLLGKVCWSVRGKRGEILGLLPAFGVYRATHSIVFYQIGSTPICFNLVHRFHEKSITGSRFLPAPLRNPTSICLQNSHTQKCATVLEKSHRD